MYAIAYARLLDHASAEDITQDTLLTAYEHLGRLRMPDSFCAWISRIAASRIGRRQAQLRREPLTDVAREYAEMPSDTVAQDESDRRHDARRLVADALRSLPESLRVPLVMRDMADAPYAGIAEALHITSNAAEKRVERARVRVKQHFARSGVDGSTLSLGLLYPFGGAFLGRVSGRVREMRTPDRGPTTSTTSSGALAVGGVGGVVLTCAVFAGAFLTSWAQMKGAGSAAETFTTVQVLAGRPAPSYGTSDTGVLARERDAGPIPENAVLIAQQDFDDLVPGQPLPGWTEGVYAQADDASPGGGRGAAMVNTNIPSAYYRFPLVQGVVTVEVWMRLRRGADANCNLWLGNDLHGWQATDYSVHESRPADGDAMRACMVVQKGDTDTWTYPTHAGPVTRFADYDGDWHHIRVIYDTRANRYDLYLDRALVRAGIPGHRDMSEGISWVSLNSGRWERARDEASLFDDLRIYVEPEREAVRS